MTLTPMQALRRQVERHPEGTAFVFGQDVWTYERLAADGERLARRFFAQGLRPGDRVAWIGKDADLPLEFVNTSQRTHDLKRRWITPGLIDCHTHLVYGGCRADEFKLRLSGASYEQIARAGGGINSTVRATRLAGEDSLLRQSTRRLQALLAEGVTAVEVKSGYGLNMEDECKILKVARRLGETFPITVYKTFLGAHAVPPEYASRADDYISSVCDEILMVSDNDAFNTVNELAAREGVFSGSSGGANAFAAIQVAKRLVNGGRVGHGRMGLDCF